MPPPPIYEQPLPLLLSVKDACLIAGMSRATLYRRFIETGNLVPRKIGSRTKIVRAELVDLRDEGAVVTGRITADGDPVADAEIFFAHLDQNRSKQIFGDRNFVFSGELKSLLGLAAFTAPKAGVGQEP